jgi:hypothetical protein
MRVAGDVTRHSWLRAAAPSALALALVSGSAPASAHTRVFIGGPFGFPVPYAYPHYYDPYPVPYPSVAYPAPPPPGWAPGHWELRYDPWGRPYQAWIPPHLE